MRSIAALSAAHSAPFAATCTIATEYAKPYCASPLATALATVLATAHYSTISVITFPSTATACSTIRNAIGCIALPDATPNIPWPHRTDTSAHRT